MTSVEAPITRPCSHCGHPVPQKSSSGRPYQYCRDNDQACLRAARSSRQRDRTSPGLAGQVNKAWELVERMELAATDLANSLSAELSPSGVERQAAEVRAEAATAIAAAHTERDEAQTATALAREQAKAANVSMNEAHAEAQRIRETADRDTTEAHLQAQRAQTAAAEVTEQAALRVTEAQHRLQQTELAKAAAEERRDSARTSAAAAEAMRAEAVSERDSARTERDLMRAERDQTRTQIADVSRERDEREAARAGLANELAATLTRLDEAIRVCEEARLLVTQRAGERDAALKDLQATQERATAAERARVHLEERVRRAEADCAKAVAARASAEVTAAGDRQAAQAQMASLTEQVSNLAAALAGLGAAGTPETPASGESVRE
ncbi:MAG: serine/threonine protein kinase [Longispora sp.]|nr:serine/threonine protein kinase [Longispora sp. (in: high G+C Gram-positive bacteria)]